MKKTTKTTKKTPRCKNCFTPITRIEEDVFSGTIYICSHCGQVHKKEQLVF